MKTLRVVRWEESQVLVSQGGGESPTLEWGLGFSLASEDFWVPCAGNPKIGLKEKGLFEKLTLFGSPEWFHLSGKEDIWVKSLTGRADFTWESSS